MLPEDAVIARQQLTPDLADDVANADEVVFVDACAQTPPGEIRVREVTTSGENWGAFVHEMSPEVLLDCVKEVHGKTPRARLMMIGAEDFSIGEGLTAKVTSAMEQAIEQLRAMAGE